MFKRFRMRIPFAIAQEIVAQAERELPSECCGLLAADDAVRPGEAEIIEISRHFELTNQLNSPIRFESEPSSLFAAMKEMRRRKWELVAIYHSHPTSPPIPSRFDLANNFYGDQVQHLILGRVERQWLARSWWLLETGYDEAEMDWGDPIV